MYLNSVASYFSINKLETCTGCMLVCAGLLASAGGIAGPLAGHFFFFCLYTHSRDVIKFCCQFLWHKYDSNLHLIYSSMCRSNCRSNCQCQWPVVFFISVCLSAHATDIFKFICQLFLHEYPSNLHKCMLVCAGPNAGLLASASADGLSFF